jgi:regulator of replication initiation timing
MQDQRLLKESLLWDTSLASEQAAYEWKLDGVYAQLQGARERIARLEEENSGLRHEIGLLQERLLRLRLEESQCAREHPAFRGR